MDHYQKIRARYKFLMMWGPSQTGKTEFIKSLFPKVLEVNCAGELTTPDLREFDSEHHEAILFDEASLAMVLENKKLFQAINSLVQMGQSNSGQYTYNVYPYRVKMIICNNTFEEELCELTPGNRDWILENSVLLPINHGNLLPE